MKSLKYNQNLIVILANKHVDIQKNYNRFKTIKSTFNNFSPFNGTHLKDVEDNSSEEDIYVEEATLFIYNEYGQLIKNFNSFQLNASNDERKLLNFKVYDFTIDEENDHMYLSTKKHGKNQFFIFLKLLKLVYFQIYFYGKSSLSFLYCIVNNLILNLERSHSGQKKSCDCHY